MPQAIMYVNSEEVARKGFGAPKRASLDHWIKKLNKAFKADLDKHGVKVLGLPFNSLIEPGDIRLVWLTPQSTTVAFWIDRKADALARL